MNDRKVAWVLGLVLIPSVSVQAGTLSVAPSLADCDAPSAHQARRYAPGTLTEVGGGIPLSYSGFGDGVPLGVALKLVLPEGYEIYGQNGVDLARPVTWSADDQPWPAVARGLLRQAGAVGVLQWEARRLLVSDGVVLPAPEGYTSVISAPLPSLSGSTVDADDAMPAVATALPYPSTPGGVPTVEAPPTPIWVLERDQSLSEGVRLWTDREGWVLLWESKLQTRVPNRAVFRGSMREAIADVVRAVNRDLTPTGERVSAAFYPENRTVLITDQDGAR